MLIRHVLNSILAKKLLINHGGENMCKIARLGYLPPYKKRKGVNLTLVLKI